MQWWHCSEVESSDGEVSFAYPVAYHPHRPLVASFSEGLFSNDIIFTNTDTKKKHYIYNVGGDTLAVYGFHPREDLLVTALGNGGDGKINIMEPSLSQKIKSTIYYHGIHRNGATRSLAFHPSNNLLAIGCYDGTVYIRDRYTLDMRTFKCDCSVESIAFHPSKDILAVGLNDGSVCVCDMSNGTVKPTIKCQNPVKLITFHEDNDFIVMRLVDNTVCIRDILTGTLIQYFRHNIPVQSVGWLDGDCVITKSGNLVTRKYEQYSNYTEEQLGLKHRLNNWLLIEKPDKQINSLEKLLVAVAQKNGLSYQDTVTIWQSFPRSMQDALLRTMLFRIQRYCKGNGLLNALGALFDTH